MKKQLLFLLSLAGFCIQMQAQQSVNFFKSVSREDVVVPNNTVRDAFPKKFDTYQLDYTSLQSFLAAAPREFTREAAQRNFVVSLPVANGEIESFSVNETAILDEEAAALFPDIHTYAGASLKNKATTVRISTTARGFRAMIIHADYSLAFVEPYTWGQTEFYIAYTQADEVRNDLKASGVNLKIDAHSWVEDKQENFAPVLEERGLLEEPIKLKIYRFCVATTGEFTQDHGGTKPLAFAAVTEYVNMLNAFYERDIALRLQLIAASSNLTFVDPLTDPYTGSTVIDWMEQNPAVLNMYANILSHDIGHVLARYITGGAIGVSGGFACTATKSRACSAGTGNGNYGSGFLHTFGQETGHHLESSHTWNRCNGGGGREGTTAFEPGSGSTIMSYAGGCNSDNVQGYGDLYFHAGSIDQIRRFYTLVGATCGSSIETTNHNPEVQLSYQDNFFIPISTPFELTGTATDIDGDSLSYCWEEMDAGPETPLGQPEGNAAIFRTYLPVTQPNRYFPKLSTIISNGTDKREVLPTYSRDLIFRLTVRDNQTSGGGVTYKDVAFRAEESAGPFVVTSPNTNTTIWRVGEYAEVKWNVANTNAAPVNCQSVNIRLSTDGGQTYPITLASGTGNDGSHYVLVPNIISNTLRVRVEAADNIFFDISNANFKIQDPVQASLTVGLSTDGRTICLPDVFNTEIYTAGVLGYSDQVNFELVGNVPPGATYFFTQTSVQPGGTSVFSLDLTQVAVEGFFTFDIRITSGTVEFIRPISLFLRRNDFSGLALQTPANGLTSAALTQTLRWSKGLDADAYDVEFSASPTFNTILASRTNTAIDSFKINFLLQKGSAYYWRVRPVNECGRGEWLPTFFFSTYAEDCKVFVANDLPKNISANGTPTVESKITVNQGGTISDVNLKQISGTHTFYKDLETHLIGPSGTDVLLWKDKCANFNGPFNFGLDDSAPGAFPCPPNNTGNYYRPVNPLTPFIGQNSTGTWTLRVKDNVSSSGGTLGAFSMEFCATLSITPPVLVVNNVMPLPSGTSRVISPDYLLVEDPNNTHAELKYTLISVPEHGTIERLNVGVLNVGDQFTQANLDAGEILFNDNGTSAAPDGFYFMVTDGEFGFFGAPKFVAQPLVGTKEAQQTIEFMLFPNPASERVQLAFGQTLESDAQVEMFNMAGSKIGFWDMPQGSSSLALAVKDLPKGLYLVSVQTSNGKGVKKLVVK